jgi:predicted nucleotidyltransferase
MEISSPFYLDILKSLNNHQVKYVLVGGLAVSYYGYSRYTGDMDLWVKPEEKNMENLYSTLIDLGYPHEIVNEIKMKREIENPIPIKLKDDNNFLKVDLLTNTFQNEFSWQQCFDKAEIIILDDLEIPVVHINQLISMKESSKRLDNSLKDQVDAQELRKIKKLRDQQKGYKK